MRPRRIGLTDAAEIAFGWGVGFARLTDGSLWGWGTYAQVPGGGPLGRLDATTGWPAITSGRFNACAQAAGGVVSCSGDNTFGQLGRGTAVVDEALPLAPVSPATDWVAFAAGDVFCGVRAGNRLSCVGRNSSGQLGRGTFTTQELNLAEVGPAGWATVATEIEQVCALRTDSSLWCWGSGPENGTSARLATPNTNRNADLGLGRHEVSLLVCDARRTAHVLGAQR